MKKIGIVLLVVFLSIVPVKIIKADSGTVDKAILEILKEKQIITQEKYQELSQKLAYGKKNVDEEILDLLKEKNIITEAKHEELEAKAAQEQKAAEKSAGFSLPKLVTTNAVKLTLGGYIDNTVVERNRYTGSDVSTKWNLTSGGFPLRNSPNYYQDEFRETARATRLSLLAEGQEDFAKLAAYVEMDFQGAGTSSNYQQTNSWAPRIRQGFGSYTTSGWSLLFGQAWSLITMNKAGIVALKENIPMTIDAGYVPGFTFTRNAQVRLVKNFGSMVSVGLSVESPQTLYTGGGLPAPTAKTPNSQYTYQLLNPNATVASNFVDVTGTTNNSNNPSTLSLDQYPDIVGKVAFDPCFGHYEVYGLARFFHSRTAWGLVPSNHSNNNTTGWGVGGAVLLPVVPKLVELQGSVLAGEGIGRYGAAQFPDVVVNPVSGKLDPIHEIELLLGLVAHPNDRLDVFTYAGMEKTSSRDILGTAKTKGFGGFGNPFYATWALVDEGGYPGGVWGSGSLVQASRVDQITLGGWYSFYKGNYGTMRIGVSDAYSHLYLYGNIPGEYMNVGMVSFRYYFK